MEDDVKGEDLAHTIEQLAAAGGSGEPLRHAGIVVKVGDDDSTYSRRKLSQDDVGTRERLFHQLSLFLEACADRGRSHRVGTERSLRQLEASPRIPQLPAV